MGVRKGLGEVGKKEQEGRGQLVTQRCSPRQAQAPAPAQPAPAVQPSLSGRPSDSSGGEAR